MAGSDVTGLSDDSLFLDPGLSSRVRVASSGTRFSNDNIFLGFGCGAVFT